MHNFKKRLLSLVLALCMVLAVGLPLASTWNLLMPVKAADKTLTNVVYGKQFVATSSFGSGFDESCLTNGIMNESVGWLPTFQKGLASVGDPVDLTLDLGATYTISSATFGAMINAANVFPGTVHVQYSPDADSTTWITVASMNEQLICTGADTGTGIKTLDFDAVQARRIRIRVTAPSGAWTTDKLDGVNEWITGAWACFSEIQIMGYETPAEEIVSPAISNVAAGKNVYTTSTVNEGWLPLKLTDGSYTGGWLAGFTAAYLASAETPVDVAVSLEDMYTVSAVSLYPAGGLSNVMPSTVILEYSPDSQGGNWKTIEERGDIWCSANDGHGPVTFELSEAVNARRIRVRGVGPSGTNAGGEGIEFMGLGEIEVYGVPTADDAVTPDAVLYSAAAGSVPTCVNSLESNGFGVQYLTDGWTFGGPITDLMQNFGWYAAAENFSEDNPTYITFNIGGFREVSSMVLYPNLFNGWGANVLPASFEIQLSDDGAVWKTVRKVVNPWSSRYWPIPVVFDFEPTVACMARLKITSASGSGATAIGEVEFYGGEGQGGLVEKTEYNYAFVSPAQATPEATYSIYNSNSSTRQQTYMSNKITVGDVKVKSFALWLDNSANNSSATITFGVAKWSTDVYTSFGSSNFSSTTNVLFKQSLTVGAGFAGMVTIDVPDGVTISNGSYLYGFNNASNSNLKIGRCSGSSAADGTNITWDASYYGRVRSSSKNGTSSANYKILSYVTYEKAAGEELVLPVNYTKLTEEKAHVIILAGQSNATGNTRVEDLANPKAEYTSGYENILISVNRDNYETDNVVFEPVKLGQGRDTTMFGPEVGLADYLNTNFPGEKFYIIKAAYSGTNLYDQWDVYDDVTLGKDGVQQGWYWFLFTLEVQEALNALVAQGLDPEIFSMLWMQGESDAITDNGGTIDDFRSYFENEKNFFNRVQKRFQGYAAPNGIAVLDAGIYEGGTHYTVANNIWDFSAMVNIQKRQHAALSQNYYYLDTNATDIDPRDQNSDLAHYDGDDMIELGQLFGQGVGQIIANAGERVAKGDDLLTRGKEVVSNSSYEDGSRFSASFLTDGRYGEVDGSILWDRYKDNKDANGNLVGYGPSVGISGGVIHRTGWMAKSSLFGGADASVSDPYTMTIDLGDYYKISTLKVMPGNPEPTFREEFSLLPPAYQIQIWNGAEWVTVAAETNAYCPPETNAVMEYNLAEPVTGSQVRMVVTRVSDTSTITIVGEFEAYGQPDPDYVPPSDAPEENPNVAYGKPVTSNNTLESGGWNAASLTDGSQDHGWHNANYLDQSVEPFSPSNPTRIAIDFRGTYEITQLIIKPTSTYNTANSYIPQNFDIQVSSNGQNWTTIHSVNGAYCTYGSGEFLVIDLDPTIAKMIRLNITGNSHNGMYNAIGEIEVMGTRADNAKLDPVLPNVALGKDVVSNNSMEGDGWSVVYLTDGVKFVSGTGGWHNRYYGTASVENPTYITIDLGRKYKISQVSLAPNMIYSSSLSGIPRDFDIQVSVDGNTWATVAEIRNASCVADSGAMVNYDFVEVDAVLVRLVITKDSAVTLTEDPNSFASTIGEIEVYGSVYKIEVPESDLLPEAGQAGLDSGIVRDESKPKKYVTIRFDDCTTQDAQIVEILKRYGVYGATFYLNTGLYGTEWTWVTDQTGASHIRYTKDQLAAVYTGFDIAAHGKEHLSLVDLTEAQMIAEVQNNVNDIAGLSFFGKTPVGLAYAGGDSEVNDFVRNVLVNNTTVRYGMGTTSSYSFALPESFMKWQPSAAITEAATPALIDQFIQTKATTDMVLTLWGHGYELDQYDYYDEFEAMIAKLAAAAAEEGSEIVFVTNSQFYQLFKNEIPSMPVKATDADSERVLDMEIIGDGYDIYQIPNHNGATGYRYGAQYLYEGNTVHAYFSFPGTGWIGEWDWISYRRSDDGGVTWGPEKIVLTPFVNSTENYSVCDPGVVKAGEYYYLAYTSTLNSEAMCNNVYVARSKNPDGPFDKWNGNGWGGVNPKPIFYYDGSPETYGIGEPSMVVKGDTLYIYYTYIGSNDLSQDYCMVATADLTTENWPATIQERGVATRKLGNNWFSTDSLDVKYVEDYGKFIAIGAAYRFTTDSALALYESTDGITFTLVDVIRQNTYRGLHNVGLSSRPDGHINLAEDADKLRVIYAYDGVGKGNQSAEGSTWAKWNTRVQPISLGVTVGNAMEHEIQQSAKPEGATTKVAADESTIIMIRLSTLSAVQQGQGNKTPMYDNYTVQVGGSTNAFVYTFAYDVSQNAYKPTKNTAYNNWTVSVGDDSIVSYSTSSRYGVTLNGLKAGTTYVDVTYRGITTRAWVTVTDTAPSSSTVLSVEPMRDQYTMYWGEQTSIDMQIRVGVTYTDYSYMESGVDASSPTVTFSGYDTSIITVDANGFITPVGVGETTVTVTCKGKTTTVPVKISIDPEDSKLNLDRVNSHCAHTDVVSVVTAPTCTVPGFTTHACQNATCRYSWIDTIVPATGHEESSSTYDPATGIRTYSACPSCGKTPETFITDWSQNMLVKVDESLKMYFYAWIDKSVVAPTLKVTRDGRIYEVVGSVVRTVGDAVEYVFAFEGVTPDHADTVLAAELYCDGYKLLTKSCSLQQYIDERKADDTLDQSEANLLDALDAYFAALENAQTGANNDVNVDGFTNVTSTDKKVTGNGNLATFKSATVGFGNDIRIRFTLQLADGVNFADLTFKVKINDGTEVDVAAGLIKLNGNTVTIYTDAIAATNLDDVYAITVYNGETAGASFTYSVKSYVYAFQSATGESEDQVLLVKALYNYGLSAKAYANAQ